MEEMVFLSETEIDKRINNAKPNYSLKEGVEEYPPSEALVDENLDKAIVAAIKKKYFDKINLILEAKLSSGAVATGTVVTIHYGSAEGPIAGQKTIDQHIVMFDLTRGQEWTAVVEPRLGYITPDPIQGRADYSDRIVFSLKTYDEVSSFADIKKLVNQCEEVEGGLELAKRYLLAKTFNDVWTNMDMSGNGDATPSTDENGHPRFIDSLICTNVKWAQDASGNTHLAAILMRKKSAYNTINFDKANREEATENAAIQGVYYYGLTKGTTSIAVDNLTIITDESGNPIPAGTAIPYQDYEKIFKNAYLDNTKQIIVYGHNRYETSAIRQYLNSSSSKGQWWTSKHIGQIKPDNADSIGGYLRGCSAELLSYIKPIGYETRANDVCDGGGRYVLYDLFYIPSNREMFGNSKAKDGDDQTEFWRIIIGDETAKPSDNNSSFNRYRATGPLSSKSTYSSRALRSIAMNSWQEINTSYGVNNVANGSYLGDGYDLANLVWYFQPMCAIY